MVPSVTRVVVGIDQARLCGWAILDLDGERVDSGTWVLAQPKDKRPSGARFDALLSNVRTLIRWCDRRRMLVQLVAYEDVAAVALKSKANMRHTIGYCAVIEMAAHHHGVRTMDVATPTVKATAGYGRADKRYMVMRACEQWDHKVRDDNEADALWIAEAARLRLLGENDG